MSDRSVAVLLCADAFAGRTGLDLAGLTATVARTAPSLALQIVESLCERPNRLRAAAGATRIVLGVCRHDAAGDEIRRSATRAGLDPFAVEAVSLAFATSAGKTDARRGTAAAAAQLVASAARLTAWPASQPEHLRMRVRRGAVSRRGFLSLAPVVYEPVAHIDPDTCAGPDRCDLCIVSCFASAIDRRNGSAVVNHDACEGCGVCVSRCPLGAVSLPGSSLAQYEAQLQSLLSSPRAPRDGLGILFACRHAVAALDSLPDDPPVPPGWLPVTVPTLSMLTPGWILQSLSRGAGAVAVLGCEEEPQAGVVAERLDYCRRILEALGSAERVRLVGPGIEAIAAGLGHLPRAGLAGRRRGRFSLLEPAATAAALTRISRRAPGAGRLRHPASPLGIVRIDRGACSVCGSCSTVCPTGALSIRHAGDTVALALNPHACAGCERCVPACPERAVAVRAETDIGTLRRGPAEAASTTMVRCRRCGAPVAPEAMLVRVERLLGGEPGATSTTRLCGDCRSLASSAIR